MSFFAGIRQDVAPRPMQALNFDLPFCRKSKVDVLLGEEQESCTLQDCHRICIRYITNGWRDHSEECFVFNFVIDVSIGGLPF